MSRTIEAVYENGVFRPVEPIKLEEGQRVQVYFPWVPDDRTLEERLKDLEVIEKESDDISDEEWAEIRKAILGDRGPDFKIL